MFDSFYVISLQLSQTVLLGLHQIAQAIQQYDYGSGLNVYTGMVSHGNFSEISNFMPAIKVLLQSAMQMQVYVQWTSSFSAGLYI